MRLRLRLAVLLFCGLAAAQRDSGKAPPDYEKKMAAIRNFEAGVVPLFAVGDLNEDGVVDGADLALLQQHLEKKSPAGPGITCLAAADLNMNGRVDDRDLAILRDILKQGVVQASALSHRARLGCSFRNFVLAAGRSAPADGLVPIHFLDAQFTRDNSSAQIVSGPAAVRGTSDGFLVQVAKTAAPGSKVTISLTLAGKRRYFYSFVVLPGA